MHSNAYLYGEGVEVPEIDPYVIIRRLELLDDSLTEVNAVNLYERDLVKRDEILEAIHFWENINKVTK